jgi:AraC family transcriptional regulator
MKASLAQSNGRLFRSIYAAWSYKKPTTWILIGIVEARHEHIIEQSRFRSVVSAGALATAASGSSSLTPPQACESIVIAQTSPCKVDLHKALAVKAGDDDFVVAHISRGARGHGMTEPHPKRAIHTACVHLSEFSGYGIWCDEKFSYGRPLPQGSIHINDMRHSWCADIQGGFDVVNFCVLSLHSMK